VFFQYNRYMRNPEGGGLTAEGRAKREQIRYQAADMFAAGIAPPQVARRLRVTRQSASAWHRVWKAGGKSALASKGPQGLPCRLSAGQIELLEAELAAGPAAHGWDEDQRWTLARIACLIHELFAVDYTLRVVSYLLHRIGWSPQVPIHRAAERDEEAIAAWREVTWPRVKARRPNRARGSASPTSPASR
jgi:putative transposase